MIKRSCVVFIKIIATKAICFLLSGCAITPHDLGNKTHPREDLIISNIKAADPALDIKSSWWRFYGDDQLIFMIESALNKSPKLKEAKGRILKAQGIAQQVGANIFPSLNGDGSLEKYRQSYNNGVPASFVPQGFQNVASANLNFNYEIDFWGKNRNAIAAASSDLKASQLEDEQAKIILATSIASVYGDLARLYNKLDVAIESVKVRSQTSQIFFERYSKGLENASSVDVAKSNLASAKANVSAIEESIALAKNSLLALAGDTPDKAINIARPTIKNIKKPNIQQAINVDLIGHRPDLQAALMRLKSAAARINVARSGFYPNINLNGYIGRQSLGLDIFFKGGSLTGLVGPAIHLPIFDGGKLQGDYRIAHADYNIALGQYEEAIIQALNEVSDALTSQNALNYRISKAEEALAASKNAYDIINKRYVAGLANYLEVLKAEEALIMDRAAFLELEARGFILEIAVIKSLGGWYKNV